MITTQSLREMPDIASFADYEIVDSRSSDKLCHLLRCGPYETAMSVIASHAPATATHYIIVTIGGEWDIEYDRSHADGVRKYGRINYYRKLSESADAEIV